MTDLAERKGTTASWSVPEAAKRISDIGLSLALIIIAAPLLLLLYVLVKSTSAGPALFRQERLGRDKQPFTLLKMRTMYTGTDDRIHRDYVTEPAVGRPGRPVRARRPVQIGRRPTYHPARRVAAPDQP